MAAVERDNPALKDVLPKDYARPALDKRRLGQLIDMIGNIRVGDADGSSGMFVQSVAFISAHASGNGNGGKVRGDISVYGQELNHTTWRLAKMNLAIRGIGGQIAHGDSFRNDRHPDLKADFILANPPFNVSDWDGERLVEDKLALRRSAEGQRELRLGAAHGPPPRAEWRGGVRAGQRVDVVESVR